MKVLHISGLHYCFEETARSLKNTKSYQQANLKIQTTGASDVAKVSSLIAKHNIDVVVVSGDLTAFGDYPSLSNVRRILTEACHSYKRTVRLVIVPGFHDLLASRFIQRTGRRPAENEWGRELSDWLSDADLANDLRSDTELDAGLIAEFREAFYGTHERPGLVEVHARTGDGFAVPLVILPYESALSFGTRASHQSRLSAFDKAYRTDLMAHMDDAVSAVALYQDPTVAGNPSVRWSHRFHGYVGRRPLIRRMQRYGVDLVFSGGVLEPDICQSDFIEEGRDQICSLSAGVFVGNGNGQHGDRYNCVRLMSRYTASVLLVSKSKRSREGKARRWLAVVFDREKVTDLQTLQMRREVRGFIRERSEDKKSKASSKQDLWKEIHAPVNASGRPPREHFVFGVRLRKLVAYRIENLRKMMEHDEFEALRILLPEAALFEQLSNLNPENHHRTDPASNGGRMSFWDSVGQVQRGLESLWSMTMDTDWVKHKKDAKSTLKKLENLWKDIDAKHRAKLEIRHGPAVMPIGGAIRYEHTGHDMAMIRLLPIGCMNRGELRSLVKLERRHDRAAFEHFRQYMEELWSVSRSRPWFQEKVSIFHVDDHGDAAQAIGRLLMDENYTTETADIVFEDDGDETDAAIVRGLYSARVGVYLFPPSSSPVVLDKQRLRRFYKPLTTGNKRLIIVSTPLASCVMPVEVPYIELLQADAGVEDENTQREIADRVIAAIGRTYDRTLIP